MFEHVDAYAGDPILTLNEAFGQDPRPHKINLSIGIYFDDAGRLPVMNAVRTAESAMLQTTMWLKHHVLDPDRGPLWMLLMRKVGDNRPDDVIKQELLDAIKHRYNIIAAFDDRDKVVQMWRNNNIACFQVAPGDF